MDAKQHILEQVLTSKFDVDSYLKLCTELFNGLEVLSPHKPSEKVWSEYKFNIASFTNVGKYINGKEKTAILAVELQSGRSVERARSLQRNFVAKLLSGSPYDAAIVAFFSADDERWRLSFVRLDYEFAAGRAKELLTPAKRYSYLVGKGEPCHTAQEQLFPIFRNEAYNPSLDKIEEAFSVERVTDGFFNKYRDKYFDLKKFLDENEIFNEEAQLHQFTSEQFAKKLMGQLAFLYFLQKKGWLGVKVVPHQLNDKQYKNAFFHSKASREVMPKAYAQINSDEYRLRTNTLGELSDEEADALAGCCKSEPWGSGTKTFIRDLYTKKVGDKYFFDDYLEPLFYEALNHRRGENNYYKRFNCKIPFLNGGLFEPLENYDWRNSKFGIPDELFSNIDTKGEREADGILDIFDRYNFTMNEDEPLEREVAVDPEMLGKIFENLLDAKDRKSKGAFYTPREIVHYMCQESLINYLVNETGAPYEEMKEFIIYGELMKDEDCSKNSTQMHIPESVYNKLGVIDIALENVKVADPAVGSGAFPLGMLSEIIKSRNNITAYYAQQSPNSVDKARIYEQRDPYKLKLQTIKNSIYAVDIEASAVDIAKLRLWLSIVVDENLDPTYEELRYGDNVKQRDPQPLPNLDYNIMCGNSLIDEFEGIKLFDDSILNKNTHDPTGATANWQTTLFSDSMDKSIEDLFKEQDRLFGEEDTNRKRTIKANIDKIIDDIIRAKLQKDGNADGHAKYEESLKQKTKPYFLWKLEFARVFKENDGFDIVIGNPPYVRVQTLSHEMIDKLKIRWSTAWKRIDISTLFMELAYSLMNSQGHMCYISSNQFLATEYGRMMRKYLIEHKSLVKIVDFGDLPIFQNALTYVSIFFVSKQAQTMFEYKKIDRLPFTLPANFDRILICNLTDDAWSLGAENRLSVIRKIKSTGNRLSKYAKCWAGVITGKDDLLMYDYEEDIPYIEDAMLTPIIRAQGCNRYVYAQPSKKIFYPYKEKNNNTELIELEELKKEYPLAYTFAVKNETELKARKDSRKTFGDKKGWYGLIRFGKLSRFRKPKIVSPGEVKDNKFSLDLTGSAFSCARVFSITVEDECVDIEYLLAILNSKLIEFFLHGVAPLKQGGYFSYSSSIIDAIPLIIENVSQQAFTTIVDQILSLKNADPNADTTSFEKQIDQMVYKLYGLTEEEIKIVEKS